MKLKCIITDDEPIAREGLEKYVRKIDFLELVATCDDAIQLNSVLLLEKVDLIFLDIEMPSISGIDFLRLIPDPPEVIFTTAYGDYALQGFELQVADYLLKPISFDRFLQAVNKVASRLASSPHHEKDAIFLKSDGRIEKILFKEIIALRAMENYVNIHTIFKNIIVHSTLKSISKALPNHFLQTHKSWIVNTSMITYIEGNTIHCGKIDVPISKYNRDEIIGKITNG